MYLCKYWPLVYCPSAGGKRGWRESSVLLVLPSRYLWPCSHKLTVSIFRDVEWTSTRAMGTRLQWRSKCLANVPYYEYTPHKPVVEIIRKWYAWLLVQRTVIGPFVICPTHQSREHGLRANRHSWVNKLTGYRLDHLQEMLEVATKWKLPLYILWRWPLVRPKLVEKNKNCAYKLENFVLFTWRWTFEFRKMRIISRLAEEFFVSQGELCCLELVRQFRYSAFKGSDPWPFVSRFPSSILLK